MLAADQDQLFNYHLCVNLLSPQNSWSYSDGQIVPIGFGFLNYGEVMQSHTIQFSKQQRAELTWDDVTYKNDFCLQLYCLKLN